MPSPSDDEFLPMTPEEEAQFEKMKLAAYGDPAAPISPKAKDLADRLGMVSERYADPSTPSVDLEDTMDDERKQAIQSVLEGQEPYRGSTEDAVRESEAALLVEAERLKRVGQSRSERKILEQHLRGGLLNPTERSGAQRRVDELNKYLDDTFDREDLERLRIQAERAELLLRKEEAEYEREKLDEKRRRHRRDPPMPEAF